MARVTEKVVKYLGVEDPNTLEEIEVELLGLETAVKKAEMVVAELRQSLSIAKLQFLERQAANRAEKKEEKEAEKEAEEKEDK